MSTNRKALNVFDELRVQGALATAIDLDSKSQLLEKEVGLDAFYALLAMGSTVASLASSINVSSFELEYMLKRTPSHRKKYINALSGKLGADSVKVLSKFSDAMYLDPEMSAAAKHHKDMLAQAVATLNKDSPTGDSGGIVVNNTVVIRDSNDVPELPPELSGVIDVIPE